PFTPGRDRASTSRSSSSTRSAMASALGPARRAPLAAWSAAMIMSRPYSLSSAVGRTRSAAAWAMACGLLVLASKMAWSCSARIGGLLELGFDLGGVGHGVGAGQAAGDDGTGGVAEAHDPFQVPAGQQAVAQG